MMPRTKARIVALLIMSFSGILQIRLLNPSGHVERLA